MDNIGFPNNIPINTPINNRVLPPSGYNFPDDDKVILSQWNGMNYPLKGIIDDVTNHILIYLITNHYEDKEIKTYIGRCIDIKALGSFKRY